MKNIVPILTLEYIKYIVYTIKIIIEINIPITFNIFFCILLFMNAIPNLNLFILKNKYINVIWTIPIIKYSIKLYFVIFNLFIFINKKLIILAVIKAIMLIALVIVERNTPLWISVFE